MNYDSYQPFTCFKAHPEFNVIADRVRALPLPKGWTKLFSDRSVSITGPKRKVIIKIDVNRSVYYDRLKKGGEVKSERWNCLTIEGAWNTAIKILEEYNGHKIETQSSESQRAQTKDASAGAATS